MEQQYAQEWPQFFTATIQEWKHLLIEDKYKNIIVDSFKFLVMKGNITLNGFAIMTNHLHIVLQEKATIEYKKYKTVS